MAGSLTWRSYTADSGVEYSIKTDESNANGVAAGTSSTGGALCPVRTTNSPRLPCGVKKRYALATLGSNPLVRRKFTVGSTAAFSLLQQPGATINASVYPGAGDTAGAGVVWNVTATRGEKANNVPGYSAADTGLTDGTISQ